MRWYLTTSKISSCLKNSHDCFNKLLGLEWWIYLENSYYKKYWFLDPVLNINDDNLLSEPQDKKNETFNAFNVVCLKAFFRALGIWRFFMKKKKLLTENPSLWKNTSLFFLIIINGLLTCTTAWILTAQTYKYVSIW